MIIINSACNYTLSSYNIQEKVDVAHSIRIKTSYMKFRTPQKRKKYKLNVI